jgi:hypothetical protein
MITLNDEFGQRFTSNMLIHSQYVSDVPRHSPDTFLLYFTESGGGSKGFGPKN